MRQIPRIVFALLAAMPSTAAAQTATVGSISVYGATADNTSQNPSLEFATKAP